MAPPKPTITTTAQTATGAPVKMPKSPPTPRPPKHELVGNRLQCLFNSCSEYFFETHATPPCLCCIIVSKHFGDAHVLYVLLALLRPGR